MASSFVTETSETSRTLQPCQTSKLNNVLLTHDTNLIEYILLNLDKYIPTLIFKVISDNDYSNFSKLLELYVDEFKLEAIEITKEIILRNQLPMLKLLIEKKIIYDDVYMWF